MNIAKITFCLDQHIDLIISYKNFHFLRLIYLES